MFLVLLLVGSLSFSNLFFFFFLTNLGLYIIRSVIPAILDFHFSLLCCSDDVDDNDGCGFLTVVGWVLWQWVSHG